MSSSVPARRPGVPVAPQQRAVAPIAEQGCRSRCCCRRAVAAALTLALGLPALGQAARSRPPIPAPSTIPTFRRSANQVLADFVVLDRRGRLVRGLTPAQLEVTDNGLRQQVESLRLVTRSARLGPLNWRAVGLLPPAAEPSGANLAVLVFDPLAPAAAPLARGAARQFVREYSGPGNYLAIFVRRRSLVLLQPFTAQAKALDAAIREATGRGTIQVDYQRQYQRYRALAAAFSARRGQHASATARAVAMPSWLGSAFPVITNTDLLAALLRRLRFDAQAEDTFRARDQLAALRSLVAFLAPYKGRKTVVLFTQRLYLRNGLKFILRALIREANQAHVTFDPVDPSGLSVRPDLAALATALRGPTYLVERQGPVVPQVGNAVNSSQTVLLGELASATGGSAVTDTNDPAGFMGAIAAASMAHYELAFIPRGFAPGAAPARHVVAIRIPRQRHWRVLARKTYYARFSRPRPERHNAAGVRPRA